jgi:hypothetical protein
MKTKAIVWLAMMLCFFNPIDVSAQFNSGSTGADGALIVTNNVTINLPINDTKILSECIEYARFSVGLGRRLYQRQHKRCRIGTNCWSWGIQWGFCCYCRVSNRGWARSRRWKICDESKWSVRISRGEQYEHLWQHAPISACWRFGWCRHKRSNGRRRRRCDSYRLK